jgi:hypothetical protein
MKEEGKEENLMDEIETFLRRHLQGIQENDVASSHSTSGGSRRTVLTACPSTNS